MTALPIFDEFIYNVSLRLLYNVVHVMPSHTNYHIAKSQKKHLFRRFNSAQPLAG